MPNSVQKYLFGALGAGLMLTSATAAGAEGFDPRDGCFEVLAGASDADKVMIAAWSFGYLSATQGDARPVDNANNAVILRNLAKACAANPGLTVLEIVGGSSKPPADAGGSEDDACEMLMQFFEDGADLAALTAALEPSENDIRAVYSDPLASKLVEGYAKLFTPGTKFGPKPDQDSLVIVRATTGGLKAGDAVLSDFPGGYGEVLPYMIGDFPIVRFKFVKSGETMGLAFDGLIFVNGRWVLMPKPWRYLE
ncbi:MAG: hypothetical protein Q9M48_16075 [Rhodobacterales bacterium]|nr:hypothetical protein [Rhodobacterales bacterium]